MTEGHTSQGTQPAVDDAEEQSDWLTWSGGTVLPDEMIDHLRETIGALDALLASTYLSRDFELPGPDDPMPSVPRPTDEPAEPNTAVTQAVAEQKSSTAAADPKPARQKPSEPRGAARRSGKSPS
jgi:hypothetical protein